jgi:Activator of Hsp90 ATPase homolog 1-like protein
VRFELIPSEGGTRLVFEHEGIPVSAAVGMSAGWHTHLDWLRSRLAGEASLDFGPRYRELGALYGDELAAA